MRIFSWWVLVGNMGIADGFVLAENIEQAEEKLKLLPYHNKYEEVELADNYCNWDGCEIDENGIATIKPLYRAKR